jgi:hypothetical protein
MNPTFFGDSYDIVKRFFCRELSELGYSVAVDAMLTGNWSGAENDFYRLISVKFEPTKKPNSTRTALFLDPDTGIHKKGGKQHVSFERLAHEASKYELVFSFDQSFSRQEKPATIMREKLAVLQSSGCHAMYYDSHARFLFVASKRHPLDELHTHLVSLGLPASRLMQVAPNSNVSRHHPDKLDPAKRP